MAGASRAIKMVLGTLAFPQKQVEGLGPGAQARYHKQAHSHAVPGCVE